MWKSCTAKLLSILSMTLSSLLGGKGAIDRPMVKIKLKGSNCTENLLYDSGAQVSLISKKSFRKIEKSKRPEKIDFKLSCSGISGNNVKVLGCYLFRIKILGREVTHPLFVVDKIHGQAGVIGIDFIKRHKLGLDVITNQPYFKTIVEPEATLTKDTFIPARSRQKCKIRVPKNVLQKNNDGNLTILQIGVEKCHQVYCDEVLIDPDDDGVAQVYLTNVSYTNQKLPRGLSIGEVEAVSKESLSPFQVTSTTPLVPEEKIKALPIPPLDAHRKQKIKELANLSHLPETLRDKYLKILYDNHACISLDEFDLGRCTKGAHSIPTKADHPPTYQKQFPLPYEHEKEIRRQVLEWLKIGIIRPCESEYNSSLFLVEKKLPPARPGEVGVRPKAYRIVQDLRALNKDTLPSNVRLPEIHECLDRIADKKPTVFSSLDLRSGYFQLPIQLESQEKTAFTCLSLGQQFCFKVTSQGLTSAPASFARTMQRIFHKQVAKNDLEVYLDDVLAYSKDHNEMMSTLDEALKNLVDSGMKINLDKCKFGTDMLTYLGFEISKDGYKPDPIKSEGITKVHEPSTLKGVRSFLGMANFYRLLIPQFSKLTKPLTKLTCKGAWTGGSLPNDAKLAFKKCQQHFTQRPFLHYPDFNLKFHLFVDASLGTLGEPHEGGLAGCLMQYPNNDTSQKPRPIGFCSRGLQAHEKNYSAHLIETAGIIFAIEFFEKYLRTPFICYTDHKPITTVKEGKVHKRTLERFKEILANYDFTLEYLPGEKMPSDFMSRHVRVDAIKINCKEIKELLEKSELEAKISQKEKSKSQTAENIACTVCAVHTLSKSQKIEKVTQACAEISRQFMAVQQASTQQARLPSPHNLEPASQGSAQFGKDESAIYEKELEGAPELVPMHTHAVEAIKKEELDGPENNSSVAVAEHNNSARINYAAGASQKAIKECPEKAKLKEKIKANVITSIKKVAKFCSISAKGKFKSFNLFDTTVDKNPTLLRQQQSIDPFIQAIYQFLRDKSLPKERYRGIIKRWGPHCFEEKGILMVKFARAGYPTRNLVVAPAERFSDIIAESHATLLGGHDKTEKTVQRILEQYWFPGVYPEVDFFIENCSICRKNKKKEKVSNTYLKPLKQANNIFERVHLDLFGPLKTHEGKAYICTIVDSFSKFAIFKKIDNKDAITVAKCFFDNWISIFGSPYVIVSDKGSDFNTETLQEICNILQIDKRTISTQHPEANSQAEVLNKALAKYLKAMEVRGSKDWPKLVSSCQYAYNLSVHKALKNSPYSVLFGVDANTPLNNKGFVSYPIYGTKYQDSIGKRLKAARDLAKSNNMKFRESYASKFNEKVKPHSFKEGQLVYLHRPEMIKINPKISSPWFGPMVILSMIGKHNALIQELSNRRTKFVNVNRLRAYTSSIAEWYKFKLTRSTDKADSAKAQPTMQSGADKNESAHAPAQPDYAIFERDSEIVHLNPEVQPRPKIIKTEPQDDFDTVSEQIPDNSDQQNVPLQQDPSPILGSPTTPISSTSDQSKSPSSPSLYDTFKDMLTPSGSKTKQKSKPKSKPPKPLPPSTKMTTRRGAQTGLQKPVPTVRESVKGLEDTEKSKRKPKSN